MVAIVITQGQYAILATVIAGFIGLITTLISVKRTAKRTEQTANIIEVNTNQRLSESLAEVKALRDTVTRLVEALAVAQESPAMDRAPIPVQVIDPELPPSP